MDARPGFVGLNALNFFAAAVQTGFGPYVAVWLIQRGWTQTDVGVALSVGTLAGLVGQLPGGWLVDAVDGKRAIAALALAATGVSALMLAFLPYPGPVWVAEAIHALAACIMTPAIAAMTLRLCGHAGYSERLGVNGRYSSLGNAVTAGLMGLCALIWPERVVFIVTALLVVPTVWAVSTIRQDRAIEDDTHEAVKHPRQRPADRRPWDIFREPSLHAFAVCAVLFHIGNAAMLTVALNALVGRTPNVNVVVSAAILVPQFVGAAIAPYMGSLAQRLGRRPVLLAGFAALPLRGLLLAGLFATHPVELLLLLFQALDAVSAVVFGLMVPLIAADVTRRTGYMNLAIGSIGLAVGIGATISTALAGWMADAVGVPGTLLGLAAVGAGAVLLAWRTMPETHPGDTLRPETSAAAA